jgi:predicted O-methyltransferase YrrM
MRLSTRLLSLAGLTAWSAIAALQAPVAAQGAVPPAINAILTQIRQADTGQLAVSEEDGRFLRTLAVAKGSRQALEIGSASGYSAIWLGLAMRDTGGRLVTIEYDKVRAREAAENVQRAGLSDVVEVVQADAFAAIPKLPGSFDFVFLDAWKKDYGRFFSLVFPRMAKGGVLLAHNVINKRDEMPDFLKIIHTHPDVLTSIVSAGHEGISLTVKRR